MGQLPRAIDANREFELRLENFALLQRRNFSDAVETDFTHACGVVLHERGLDCFEASVFNVPRMDAVSAHDFYLTKTLWQLPYTCHIIGRGRATAHAADAGGFGGGEESRKEALQARVLEMGVSVEHADSIAE